MKKILKKLAKWICEFFWLFRRKRIEQIFEEEIFMLNKSYLPKYSGKKRYQPATPDKKNFK